MKVNRKILCTILFVLLTSSILISSSQLNTDDQNNRNIEYQEKSYLIESNKHADDNSETNFQQLKIDNDPTLSINIQDQDLSSNEEG
ncbi:MAG: hypothetical protein VW886_00665, partial [Candidatus Heimdallarchaeota archaeon]